MNQGKGREKDVHQIFRNIIFAYHRGLGFMQGRNSFSFPQNILRFQYLSHSALGQNQALLRLFWGESGSESPLRESSICGTPVGGLEALPGLIQTKELDLGFPEPR